MEVVRLKKECAYIIPTRLQRYIGIFRAFEVIRFMKLGKEDLTTGHMLEKNAK